MAHKCVEPGCSEMLFGADVRCDRYGHRERHELREQLASAVKLSSERYEELSRQAQRAEDLQALVTRLTTPAVQEVVNSAREEALALAIEKRGLDEHHRLAIDPFREWPLGFRAGYDASSSRWQPLWEFYAERAEKSEAESYRHERALAWLKDRCGADGFVTITDIDRALKYGPPKQWVMRR